MVDDIDEDAERNELLRLGLPLAFSSRSPVVRGGKKRQRTPTGECIDQVTHRLTHIDGIKSDDDDDDDDDDDQHDYHQPVDVTRLNDIPPTIGKRVLGDGHSDVTSPLPAVRRDNSRQRRRRLRNGLYPETLVPIDSATTSPHIKYWSQRYRLFDLFDRGIQLDESGWFSVTPQTIAHHQALKASNILRRAASQCTAVDAMCGCGGNAIALAHYFGHVIAVEHNGRRLAMAKHNARIYGVEARIDFVHGDYLRLASRLRADVVILAPEWGGPEYLTRSSFVLADVKPVDGELLLSIAQTADTEVVVYILPRNIQLSDVRVLCQRHHLRCDVESNCLNGKIKMKTLYFTTTKQRTKEYNNTNA